jgi:glycosyltransferase involved in cell wall biosynthesis
MNRRLKIGFLPSLTLVNKLSSWNITNGYMAQVLGKYCGDITYIEPMHIPELLPGKVFNKATQLLLKKSFMYYHSFFIARKCARLLTKQLSNTDFDVIFAPACASETAFLEIDTPIVIVEDANFALLHNYYAQFSNLLQRSHDEANTLEELALNKAALVLHPSPWARRSSLENYHVAQEKVYAVPFGANVDNPPTAEIALTRKKSDQCKLLFIGVDWERKGGAIAFATLLKLEELGIQAELTICGCVPPPQFTHERLKVIPFLNRKDEKQRREMETLFETSDFLFLPTRGECYGMVFCEASSYGLPSITTDTGGVSGAVTNGENGFMLPLSAGGSEYAELIAKAYRDDQSYAELVKSSRAAYEDRLNWDAWGTTVTKLIFEMLERQRPHAQGRGLASTARS